MTVLILAAAAFSSFAAAAVYGQGAGPSATDTNSSVYVREEAITQHGLKGETQTEMRAWRLIWICDVTQTGETFVSKERGTAQLAVFAKDGSLQFGKYTNVVWQTVGYDTRHGRLPMRLPTSAHEGFTPASLSGAVTGLETFLIPLKRDGDLSDVATGTDQVELLHTQKSLVPELAGAWSYRWDKRDGGLRASGPYFLESSDNRFVIAGALQHDVDLHPFRFKRMSAKFMCRIRPAEAMFSPDPSIAEPLTAKLKEIIEGLDGVIVATSIRMVPRHSPEGKSIEIPDSLKNASSTPCSHKSS
jgi:hypothetical protein